MKRLFDMENPLMQGLSIVADMMILNVLTLICSLPILTAGAALTAMNDVVIRIVRQEEGSVIRDYFKAFHANLKNGILLGIALLAAAGLLYFDYLCALTYAPAMRYGIAAIAVLLLALALYAFALLARYENTLRQTVKNAAALSAGYFPRTLGMLCFCLAFWLLCIRFFRYGAPILLMFGLSLPCYMCIMILRPVFERLENEKEHDE